MKLRGDHRGGRCCCRNIAEINVVAAVVPAKKWIYETSKVSVSVSIDDE